MIDKNKLAELREQRLNLNSTELAVREDMHVGELLYKEAAWRSHDPVGYLTQKRNIMLQFVKSQMIQDQDYGEIPGTKEKGLFKPGAEKLLSLFNYGISVQEMRCVEDWDKPLFSYTYRAVVRDRHGFVLAECDGNCNSMEKKYRYRWINESSATSEQKEAAIDRRKASYGARLLVPNDDLYSIVNTIMKMAEKRAIVGATLLACNASAYFRNLEQQTEVEAPANRHTMDADVVEDSPAISEAQLKRLWAISSEGGYSPEGARGLMESLGYKSSRDIPVSEYETVCKLLGNAAQAKIWNAQVPGDE
jgi:hypothetical protein